MRLFLAVALVLSISPIAQCTTGLYKCNSGLTDNTFLNYYKKYITLVQGYFSHHNC